MAVALRPAVIPFFHGSRECWLLASFEPLAFNCLVARCVRMTLDGIESTRGAEVDVTFRDFRKIDGVLWPTDFDERIRVPFDLHAHHWKMLGLDTSRGLRALR